MVLKLFRNNRILILFTFISVLLSSCSSYKSANIQSSLRKSNCNQQNVYTYEDSEVPMPIYTVQLDSFLLNNFTFKSLNVAHAIGVLPLLEAYGNQREIYRLNPTLENKVHIIEISQLISQKINNTSLEISAVSSEMDCEEERTGQIANYLKGLESDKESKLTVASIVVGASGAILSGIYNNEDAGTIFGITAGIAEAGLGVMILINRRKIEFMHPRNALRDVWEGQTVSSNFPASIWYYLNYHNPAQPEEKSLRYQIIEKWVDFGQISGMESKKKKKLLNVYFGDGGKYSSQQLSNRADMYDQLESYINLMKQDLKSLSMEVINLVEKK